MKRVENDVFELDVQLILVNPESLFRKFRHS